ncbi:23S rRNA (cytidine(2498)-2'-O)-methyltransferase RlmM [Bowmanella sp. JS7-9]|uniref:Ribosomal RNA large subunit methyltransferase M n=1 Tax=Pseudobowmanella zhangzhouensis TaxID=1537679 RepID=A0ABW1XJG1_9ALTE|nr:23S rRNA (cytidine(2498)-2'-O)-methyltransferase RlmM [Bowmanella sp. JS7-9]TBX27437.1 23S rRNA methyltransferase [Bowmanella sp. JS7-9]
MKQVILYCRAGFEADLALEIQTRAAEIGVFGYAVPVEGSAWVKFECYTDGDAERLIKSLAFEKLVFARQWFAVAAELENMPAKDRISPILAACQDLPQCDALVVEYADNDQDREMATFCRKFTVPLRQAMRGKGLLTAKEGHKLPTLHVFLQDSANGFVGISYPANASGDYMGISRLKFPSAAPSRSTLKLEEAINLFLSEKQREQWFKPGMHGVDLGACPGGWTYQLVSRGVKVQAIDNGMIDENLMATGLVKHIQADGFKYKPQPCPVDWLVCDMIERPDRVAQLMAQWLADGWAKRAIFNLKLPMKKRFASYQQCLEIIDLVLARVGSYTLKARHLYHDREEITLFLALDGKAT